MDFPPDFSLNHLVEGTKEIKIHLENRDERNARIVGRDPKTDPALIRADTLENFVERQRRSLCISTLRRIHVQPHLKS